MRTAAALRKFYNHLLAHFGPQHWWPGETPFEVMVGAVLTQNTSWRNVEKAIAKLKAAELLSPAALAALQARELARNSFGLPDITI
jgi:endonuclease-3 related protein